MTISVLYAPALSALKGQSHYSPRVTFPAPSLCGATCPPQEPPVMIGWGGLRLDSATTTCSSVCYQNSTFVPSNVFPGQSQSDMERLVVRMRAMGFNTIRVSFAPYCTNPTNNPPDPSDSVYNLTDAQNMAKIASYYNFWIVLRYDGDNDISTATTCWLNYWQTVIQQVGPLYDQIVWEPINEPGASVSVLSADYQSWINMARSNGDKHFIAIENQCSSITGCPFSAQNAWQGYPTVTDSLGKVLISYHPYYGWQNNSGSWNAAGAIAGAQTDYQVVVLGEQNTGWYALNTEGGADPQVADCNGPPDCILPGPAGYANVTLVYIQTLTHLLDSHVPRINWVWWPAASWTGTPCAGTYGALQPAYCPGGTSYSGGVGWGSLLNYVPVSSGSPPPLKTSFTFLPPNALVNSPVTFTAVTTGGTLPYAVSWDFGDGTTGNGDTITHSFTKAQTFQVTETATDLSNPSQTSTDSHSITTFTVLPLSTTFIASTSTPGLGQPVTFTASATGGTPPYTYSISFGDGGTASGNSATHTYSTLGSYVANLTVTDSAIPQASVSASLTINLQSLTPPVLTIPGNQTVAAGNWINFTVTASPVNTGGTVTLSATGLPTGATFDTTTGAFSWRPSVGQTGIYTIVFIATDSSSPSTPASKPMGIRVNQAAPPGGSNGGSGGGGGSSNGSCLFCGILPSIFSRIGLLIIGGLLGLISTLALFTIRARAILNRRNPPINQLVRED